MKCPKPRHLRWLGLLLIPPALWGVVLAIAPTDWAKNRLVARLEVATGRAVRLEALRLGTFGGVRLRGLEIGERGQGREPWLRAEELRIDANLLSLVRGSHDPKEVEAFGVALRIHRRADGGFEFNDLLRTAPRPEDATGSNPGELASESTCSVNFRLRGGKISVLDDPTGTHLQLADIEAKGTWQRHRATIQEMKGLLNGGTFELSAQLDREADGPSFEVQARAADVALDSGMDALGYLLPVLAGMPEDLDGKIGLDLYLRGRGASAATLGRTLVGRGDIAIDPIRLDGLPLVADLGRVVRLPEGRGSGSIRSDFEIQKGRITSKDLTVTVAGVPITLAGWTDFDGRVDYRVRPEALAQRLPPGVQGLLSDLSIKATDLAALRVQGTVDDLKMTIDGVAVGGKGDPAHPQDDRARLREISRRLKQRLLR